jgi:hypothetical protein
MPRGEGSTRVRCLSADLLEGRLLLSHVTSLKSIHTSSQTSAQVSPNAGQRPEVDSSRSATSSNDVETRDNDQIAVAVAAGSVTSILPQKSASGFDEPAMPQGALSPLNLRVVNRDDLIAWGLRIAGDSSPVTAGRHPIDETLEVPAPESREVDSSQIGSHPVHANDMVEAEALPSPQGSDLLAHFLPADRASIDRAIDQILDGFEGLGSEISQSVEATGGISPMILWSGCGIIAIEIVRRRIRRLKSSENLADDRDLNPEPAIGLPIGFPA